MRLRTDAYYERQKRLGSHGTSAALTTLKQQPETAWLRVVSGVPLQQALRHLDRAFGHIFAGHAQYPRFKRKHGRHAATYAKTAFTWEAEICALTLAKMDRPMDRPMTIY